MKTLGFRRTLFAFTIVALVGAMGVGGRHAEAGHFSNWLTIQAPFAGTWNKTICPDPQDPYSPQCAAPENHHKPWGGDWSTDYYQTPGASGGFRIANSAGGTAYGYLAVPAGSSCAGSTWAGYAYTITAYDGSGSRGFLVYAHVSGSNGIGGEYVIPQYTTLYDGNFIGYTAFWGQTGCYNVSTFSGVHWHVEMGQPTHYACWAPWSPASSLGTSDMMGAIGSNAVNWPYKCW